jgi:putative ABC transport system permease protein
VNHYSRDSDLCNFASTLSAWIFLETLGIALFRGRNFSEIDTENAPLVAVVNEVLAANVWPGEDPIGQTLYYPGPNNGRTPIEVIGVVRNTQMRSLRAPPGPFMFIPFKQNYEPIMRLHVRTLGDPMAVSAGVLQRIAQLDESLPVYQVSTLQERVADSLGETTLSAILITVFGALALLLAGVGLYGTIAFAVSQRRHEFGVRFALGAQRADVLHMMLRQGLKLALAGVGIGLAGALGMTRLVQGLLYGVDPTDPATFGAIAVLLVTIALLASYLPARRATRIDPLEALRSE